MGHGSGAWRKGKVFNSKVSFEMVRLRKGQKVEGCSSIELSENGMTYVRILFVLDDEGFIDNF